MSIEFRQEGELGKAISLCWTGLDEDRGARAEFRRFDRAVQVVMTSFFHRQLKAFRPLFVGESAYEERLAQIIGLLAHVRVNHPGSPIAVQMATERAGGPAVSELRFRRLLQRSREEFYPAMIRVLRLLRGEANICSLAESTYFWGDAVRKRWANDYYASIPQ